MEWVLSGDGGLGGLVDALGHDSAGGILMYVHIVSAGLQTSVQYIISEQAGIRVGEHLSCPM
jgi:hypothetical protein